MKTLMFAIALIFTIGCSQQWRTGDEGVSATDMMGFLNNVSTAQSTSSSGSMMSAVLAQKDDPNVTIYFGEAGPPQPNVLGVLAFDTLDFLDASQGWYWGNIQSAQVFFLSNPSSNDFAGLIIGIIPNSGGNSSGSFQYYAFAGTGSVDDSGEYSATLLGDNGSAIIVQSDDVSSGSLNGNIGLRVYELDSAGNENYIGNIPFLNGYH